ncbi:DNA adenine methylase [Mediannikoviicoccus vaginalis]|uniref:DNA adenine methylase n=1 Tax=Mediannikoviicoccus vaginalis TaxID=2899727 RepID=UPI001F16D3C2|nr:DNA adenine methylase [Mediannikoviicoccus vaginalis]
MPRTYSPLRYPGGKTQLSRFVMQLLELNKLDDIVYTEPFAGGFGAGLELLFKNKVKSVIINDYDIAIYSIWYAILNETERFINDINNIKITIQEWEIQKDKYNKLFEEKKYSYDLALATYFLNRTNRSGIITGGPIGGKNQKSNYKLDCRFNKDDLIKKILKIKEYKEKIQLYNLESNDFIEKIILKYNPDDIFVFFDPPYYEQGKNLYTNFFKHDNHVKLQKKIKCLTEYYWIMTYDNKQEIRNIYQDYKKYLYSINYYAANVRKAKEILIHSDKVVVNSCNGINMESI